MTSYLFLMSYCVAIRKYRVFVSKAGEVFSDDSSFPCRTAAKVSANFGHWF
jgi:hypothetical protein